MGSLEEDFQIAAVMADAHVGDAHASTEKASQAYDKGYAHVGAALGMLVQLIDEFGLAQEAFKAGEEHMRGADASVEKAQKIVEDIGLSESSNPLAQGQAEQIQQIAPSTVGSLAVLVTVGIMAHNLERLATDFRDDQLAPSYLNIEENDPLPALREQMLNYRRLAEEYFREKFGE